jgi:hypothetical protein
VDTVTKLEQDLAHKHKAELGKRKIGPKPYFSLQARVVDPYSFFTDPDPELDDGGQYGSRALMTKT